MLDLLLPQIFAGAAQRRLGLQGSLIFGYHGIGAAPKGARDPFLFVPRGRFEKQLSELKARGFTPRSLDHVASGEDLARGAVITFDDGRRDVFENALDPLAEHGFPAIQFLVAGLIGGRNEWDAVHGDAAVPLMDAAQVRDWMAAGHAIGSHSLTHRNLTKLSPADAREQIGASRKLLEDEFGVPVRHFAYPHGQWNPRVRDLVAEAGYATACTVAFGPNTEKTHPLELRRIAPLSAVGLLAKAAHRVARRLSFVSG